MKKTIMAAFVVALCTYNSLAGSITITATNKDAQVSSGGTTAFVSQVTARIGNTTGIGTNTSYVMLTCPRAWIQFLS